MEEKFKYAVDVGAVGVTGLAFLQYLPYIAAAVSIVWGLIRIYETKTVQGWMKRVKGSKLSN